MSRDLCSTLCTQTLVHGAYPPGACSEAQEPLLQMEARNDLQVIVDRQARSQERLQKTTIDVLGICCPSEVPLVRKILEPLPGVQEVLINVAARRVTVSHDSRATSAAFLVKALNDSKLEASIHHQGEWKAAHKWPNPYTIACGVIVALTFFQYKYKPLRWVGLGAVAVGIPPIILRSFVSLRRCILDINILMLIAVSGAIFLGDYLEAGSIVFLFTLADWLESRSSDKARMAISAVMSLAPQNAFLADSGLKVPVAEVKLGTKLSVRAGDHVPIDGIVVNGNSAVDESSLTGESMPVEKEAGATVWAGTLNLSGYLCIQTTALAEESAVARMVRQVEEAQMQRSTVEQLVEKFARYYTPVIVIVATATAIIPVSIHAHHIRHWLYVALVLLVVACPCALVISTPVTTTCAIAQAARMGLIVKGGSSLEALGKLQVIAIDKTGTLTEGHFQVQAVHPLRTVDLSKLLYWILSVESKSSHPMASSLVAYAKMHGIEPSYNVESFRILAGEGVSGVVDGHLVHIGNERLAKQLNRDEVNPAEAIMVEEWQSQGWSISWIAIDRELEAILCAGDQVRAEAQCAMEEMRKLGLHIVMLTGDSSAAANVAQKKLGTLEVHAQLLPQDKVEVIKHLKSTMGTTGMVGDGINDAPALAAADVGIAMGVAGSAVAMETADIALMTNDLRQLGAAVKLGRRVRWKIQQNIFMSISTKLVIIVLAGVGYASLWGAVLADVGTCLIVIFNSMLLLGREKRQHADRHNHRCRCHHQHNTCNEHTCDYANNHDYNQKCCKDHRDNHQNGSIKHICTDEYENNQDNLICADDCKNSQDNHQDHQCQDCDDDSENSCNEDKPHRPDNEPHHNHRRNNCTASQTSCLGKGKPSHLKPKLAKSLVCNRTRKREEGEGCCSDQDHGCSVEKQCHDGGNSRVRRRWANMEFCSEDCQWSEDGAMSIVRIREGMRSTKAEFLTQGRYPGNQKDLDLCASYCACES